MVTFVTWWNNGTRFTGTYDQNDDNQSVEKIPILALTLCKNPVPGARK